MALHDPVPARVLGALMGILMGCAIAHAEDEADVPIPRDAPVWNVGQVAAWDFETVEREQGRLGEEDVDRVRSVTASFVVRCESVDDSGAPAEFLAFARTLRIDYGDGDTESFAGMHFRLSEGEVGCAGVLRPYARSNPYSWFLEMLLPHLWPAMREAPLAGLEPTGSVRVGWEWKPSSDALIRIATRRTTTALKGGVIGAKATLTAFDHDSLKATVRVDAELAIERYGQPRSPRRCTERGRCVVMIESTTPVRGSRIPSDYVWTLSLDAAGLLVPCASEERRDTFQVVSSDHVESCWRAGGEMPDIVTSTTDFHDNDWDGALRRSRASGRPALLVFSSEARNEYCPIQKAMREVLAVRNALASVELSRVFLPEVSRFGEMSSSGPYAENARRMKAEFGVAKDPLQILVGSDGRELARFEQKGGNFRAAYLEFLRKATVGTGE